MISFKAFTMLVCLLVCVLLLPSNTQAHHLEMKKANRMADLQGVTIEEVAKLFKGVMKSFEEAVKKHIEQTVQQSLAPVLQEINALPKKIKGTASIAEPGNPEVELTEPPTEPPTVPPTEPPTEPPTVPPTEPPTQDGAIRLVNGTTPYEGRIEIFHAGRWGTICRSYWSINHVKVACKQLGYGTAKSVVFDARYGHGLADQPIFLRKVLCLGSERTLADCGHKGWEDNNCKHDGDVSVRCEGSAEPKPNPSCELPCKNGAECRKIDGEKKCDCFAIGYDFFGPLCENNLNDIGVRIMWGDNNARHYGTGRLQILVGGKWGSICAKGMSHSDKLRIAHKACVALGKGEMKGQVAYWDKYYGEYTDTDDVTVKTMRCNLLKHTLLDCPREMGSDCGAKQALLISCPY